MCSLNIILVFILNFVHFAYSKDQIKFKKWTEFNIRVDNLSFNSYQSENIRQAVYQLEKIICIPISIEFSVFKKDFKDYVYIQRSDSCHSERGKIGGKQEINLTSWCANNQGLILHELMHSLGFGHEHCRRDRDRYVTIHWENIQDGRVKDFCRIPSDETFGLAYDLKSVMHYWGTYARKGLKSTMSSKTGEAFGLTDYLTNRDIRMVKKLYTC